MIRWVWGELAAFGRGQFSRDIRTLLLALLVLLTLWFAFQVSTYVFDRVALVVAVRRILELILGA
jgi:hypothetical protein